MRKLIQSVLGQSVLGKSVLGTTAALAFAVAALGCAPANATAPGARSTSFQTPARPTDNMNAAGDGYNGGASENVNRGTTPLPTSIGGGPTAASPDATGGSMGTSGNDSTTTDMTGDVTTPDTGPNTGPDTGKDKKKSAPSPK